MIPRFLAQVKLWHLPPALCALWLTGCSLAPTYQRPEPAVPARLGQLALPAETSQTPMRAGLNQAELKFVRDFSPANDLTPMLERALANNPDYRQAVLRVDQTRAQYRIEEASRMPTIGATASRTRQHYSNEALEARYAQDLATATVGITDYEIDFFGRMKSLSDEARARYLETEYGRQAARGALIAEVLKAYALAQIAGQVREHREAAALDGAALLEIAARGQEVGIVARDELDSQRSTSDELNVAAIQAADDERAALRALRFLVGYDVTLVPLAGGAARMAPGSLAALQELDSEVLLQRPDILQAEAELRASNANIGAARAAFFPRISLTTTTGLASNSLSDLFSKGSRMWTFSPQLTLPIFDFGNNTANLDLAKTRKAVSVAEYEKSVQTAFREVADALDTQSTLTESEARQREQAEREQLRIERMLARADRGLEDRRALLAVRLRATQATLAHLQSERELALNRIAMFRAFYGIKLETGL